MFLSMVIHLFSKLINCPHLERLPERSISLFPKVGNKQGQIISHYSIFLTSLIFSTNIKLTVITVVY